MSAQTPDDPVIVNPILRGFNPDPNIVFDGERYLIAVSTFEWMPAVRIYSSTDLVRWRYETSALGAPGSLDLSGNGDNCSVWAPSMTYRNGVYHLIYTDVKAFRGPFADQNNYVVTARDIHGPWSEPAYVNGSGFDPSLFFDDDGRLYVVNALWDWRVETKNKSDGIALTELDPSTFAPVGEPVRIYAGTEARMTEAPQLYKRDGWYYLMTAEGGTGLGHQVTVARSRAVTGPYETDPATPLLTSSRNPELDLQCSGHASLVETPDGEWYLAHLSTRPLSGNHPILGRETALQRVEWTDDGWLRLAGGGYLPRDVVPAPRAARTSGAAPAAESRAFRDPLTQGPLDFARWNTLRALPDRSWLTFSERGMTIRGGMSPRSDFDQHVVGTRQTDFAVRAGVTMDYAPTNLFQMAGLMLYLNTGRYLFMAVMRDGGRTVARLIGCEAGDRTPLLWDPVPVEGSTFRLGVDVDHDRATFTIRERVGGGGSAGGDAACGAHEPFGAPRVVASDVDVSFLSVGFTGNFIAVDCVDMNRRNASAATFRDFVYDPDEMSVCGRKGTL
ncbi:glycosyl hydrolase, family 43 [Bifidobacterium sp. DSM 109958]|uniref:Glycosyl hydrolase, family 43 n=1 Tax=Bifidobacterium moraviense TaxID=2675323 RepID=A0A7Y0I059_9BIFI|nr:family 43 glycosylhydrolase [Bifidobacterium sp. DSM 109958]NMN00955.1 glycosyl hydrolase, family 43 [Bifidobacterium sp. DSM 109958]